MVSNQGSTSGGGEGQAGSYSSTPAASTSLTRPNEVDLLKLARSQIPRSSSPHAVMQSYRAYRDAVRQTILSTYNILGFLSSGTYGRVYKASLKNHPRSWGAEDERSGVVFAIKKFKPDKEEHATYTGISQSAMREIALNRELRHTNIVTLREVTLEDKSIYMVFNYASHDLLQIIHHHSTVIRGSISMPVLKSLLFQLLNGVHYLHSHFVLHRDLKPANILLTCDGVVKIADLGLARIYQAPLQSLYAGDKVVVTIWYRAPELLLGARHYNFKIDMWAVGCIWGELLALRPMFKGDEAKMDAKSKTTPFQADQFARIIEVMGNPNKERWPGIEHMPDYKQLWPHLRIDNFTNNLYSWYSTRAKSAAGFDLLEALLQYDPIKRLSAKQALDHPYFLEKEPFPTANAFASLPNGATIYPARKLIKDESDPKMMPVAASTVQLSEGGGTNLLPRPGMGAVVHGLSTSGGTAAGLLGQGNHKALGGANASLKSNFNHSLFSAVGPSAPPPAPASGGSAGPTSTMNSGGPSNAASNNVQQSQSITQQQAAPFVSRGNLIGTATANAGRAAKRQKKG
ncbi:hypothetical protein CBS101457_006558 [Exobasidium rhododendri]|nr:hypothetical protein CBS101457_006558 [Exobasidium rhododendri]